MGSFWDDLNFSLNEYRARTAQSLRKIEFGPDLWDEVKKLAPPEHVPRGVTDGRLTTYATFGTPVHVVYCLAPDTMIVTPNGH